MSAGKTIKGFIKAQIEAGGPPSLEEIADNIPCSKTNAREHIQYCIDNGFMTKEKGKARSYALTPSGQDIAGGG